MAISHVYWHLVVKNGNFILLMTSSGQEWQFHMSTDRQLSRMAIAHIYWHLVVKNGNFLLLLTCSGQEWQFLIQFCEAQQISAISLKTLLSSSCFTTLNKEVWTWKDDWPPWRTSTYERPFTREGNYLVILFHIHLLPLKRRLCNLTNMLGCRFVASSYYYADNKNIMHQSYEK